MKNFYSSIFREDDARPTPTLPVPTIAMPVPQFSIPVVPRESQVSISQKKVALMTFTRRWYAGLLIFLTEPLSKLFVNSLTTAVVPTDWRLAIICPIHKKGDPEDDSNYRPVSLTSIIC